MVCNAKTYFIELYIIYNRVIYSSCSYTTAIPVLYIYIYIFFILIYRSSRRGAPEWLHHTEESSSRLGLNARLRLQAVATCRRHFQKTHKGLSKLISNSVLKDRIILQPWFSQKTCWIKRYSWMQSVATLRCSFLKMCSFPFCLWLFVTHSCWDQSHFPPRVLRGYSTSSRPSLISVDESRNIMGHKRPKSCCHSVPFTTKRERRRLKSNISQTTMYVDFSIGAAKCQFCYVNDVLFSLLPDKRSAAWIRTFLWIVKYTSPPWPTCSVKRSCEDCLCDAQPWKQEHLICTLQDGAQWTVNSSQSWMHETWCCFNSSNSCSSIDFTTYVLKNLCKPFCIFNTCMCFLI